MRRAGIGEFGTGGRRSKGYARQGVAIRPDQHSPGVHLVGTVMAAVDRGASLIDGMIDFRPADVRGAVKLGKQANLIVFVVDTSGSMVGKDRLQAVTGSVVSLLTDAYQRRDKVAVITARGSAPELVLPPTRSTMTALQRLEGTPTGGRTPLGAALIMADELMARELRKDPSRRPLLVVLSDGRDTSPTGQGGVRTAASRIARSGRVGSIVIDCEQGRRIKLGLAKELAKHLQAACVHVTELHADAVTGVIATL
ncbi:VWA domain-containing protein [Corynebacterium choanae]|uniref:Magnesium-chelatase 60 kDa subunit n=1 Tax=Corynebacterium choanae TaxID=1862358 RepID=A0A3G6J6U9_9CORY|nr:VWA domain-containing protein [Corynebacterium choanae]AZA13835.1 Magnesium-chelatase 60 kDa subunit [Corynebacterium choanae]